MRTYFFKTTYHRGCLPSMTIFRNVKNRPKHLTCGGVELNVDSVKCALKLLYDCGEISKKIYNEACMVDSLKLSLTKFEYKNIRIFDLDLI